MIVIDVFNYIEKYEKVAIPIKGWLLYSDIMVIPKLPKSSNSYKGMIVIFYTKQKTYIEYGSNSYKGMIVIRSKQWK